MTVVIAEFAAPVASPVVKVGADTDVIVEVAHNGVVFAGIAAVVDEDVMVTAVFIDDGEFVTNIGACVAAAQVVAEGNVGVLTDVITATELKAIGTEGVVLEAAAAGICKDL